MNDIDSGLIKEAVQVICNPLSSPEARRQAHEFLESVQEACGNSFKLVEIGFDFAARAENATEIRRCGLQFIEHSVKFGWYNHSADEKQLIKTFCFGKLALALPGDHFLDSNSGKDGLAKIIVEIAKREWPQQWPSFLSECEELCELSTQQTQLALLVLLRLVEDVSVLQNVENASRRKELYSALVLVAPDLLRLSLSILRRHCPDPKAVQSSFKAQSSDAQVCLFALRFICSLMDWVPAKDLQAVKSDMLPLLCQLLSLSSEYISVKLESADCLLQLVSRKHSNKQEMMPALDLFNPAEMTIILEAAKTAAGQVADEGSYAFLKSISNILNALGQTLCILWGHSSGIQKEPDNFGLYLNAELAFFEHPSLALRFQAVITLIWFCQHEEIRKCQTFTSALPAFVQRITINTRKVGFPSKDEAPHSYFSSLDYEDDAEFLITFNRFRDQTMTFLRLSVAIDYTVAYKVGRTWFLDVVSKVPSAVSSLDSPAYESELESMNRFLNVLFLAMSKKDAFSELAIQNEGREMLALVLSKMESTTVPWLLNHLLSTASALCPFLVKHSDFIPSIIRVVFFCATFTRGELETPEDRCKNLRHHAMHEFVRLSVEFTDQLLIYIDDLLPQIFQWSQKLSPRQKCCLAEGLAALSNRFQDFDRQSALIAHVLNDCVGYWTSASLCEAVANPENFMRFVGLCQPAPTVWRDDSAESVRRREMLNACVMLSSVLNRSSLPSDQEALERGRFLVEYSGRMVTRHPAFDVFQPLFVNIFSLARCLNGVYAASSISKIHLSFGGAKVIDVPDVEKFSVHASASAQVLVGRNDTEKMFQKLTIADHVKAFVADLTEQAQILVGLFGSKFKWQFFTVPQASNFLLHGCLAFIDDMLDLRLRFVIRLIGPAFATLINSAYGRLQSRWDLVTKRREEMATAESGGDLTSQEVYLEDLTCVLTRELVLFICRALLPGQTLGSSQQQQTTNADDSINSGCVGDKEDAPDDVAMENGFSNSQKSRAIDPQALTDLGEYLCDPKNGCVVPLTLTIFHALSWPDTKAAVKSIPLCDSVAEKLTANGFLDEQAAVHLFSRALAGIQLHGEHENASSPLLTLACQLYERWYQKYPKVREVMTSVPGCSLGALKDFDEKLLGSTPSRMLPEKVKKDRFKKLIKSIIGTNIGQQFKRSVQMRDLPAMWVPWKPKVAVPTEELGICNLFGRVDS